MDEIIETPPAPRWIMVAAIAALLFEIAGCAIYLMQMTVDPGALPLDQQATWNAAPMWMLVAYGVAVGVGLIGAIMLVMRRRLAERLLLVSFAAVIVQFSALLFVPALRNLTTSDDLLLPFVIIVVSYTIWHFARTAVRRGWLR